MPPERLSPNDDPTSPHVRRIAEGFGADAARYDRTRPRYPAALIERIVAESPGREMLDVGCGTGIVARQLTTAGCRVLGVEPDERMAELARAFGIEVEIGKIEAWDPAGRTFDAVVAGQTWHWVDMDAGAAKAAEALRPGGLVAVFWNSIALPPDLGKAFQEAYQRAVPNSPLAGRPMPGADGYLPLVNKAADGMRGTGAFGEPQTWQFPWEHTYDKDEWLDQVPTFGSNTQLPADTLRVLLDGTGAAIDGVGGSFTATYTTQVAAAVRI